MLLEIIRDTTVRKADERRIQRLSRLYETIAQTNESIIRCVDQQTLLTKICAIAQEFGGLDGAWVGLVDGTSGRILPTASSGQIGRYLSRVHVTMDGALPQGHGPTGKAIREAQPVFCLDAANDPTLEPWREIVSELEIRSVASYPLYHDGRVLGTLSFYSSAQEFFDAEVLGLLSSMATNVSYARVSSNASVSGPRPKPG